MSTISIAIPAAPAMPEPTQAELAQAIRALQFVAVQAITRLIGTETDPRELRRLLTIAPRYRIPGASRPASPPRPPTEPRPRTDKHPANPANPRNQADDQSPGDDFPDDTPESDLPDEDLPPLLPMTDDQYFALVKQIGITEATRRRAINAALIAADRKRARGSS